MLAAANLHPLSLKLAPVALIPLAAYPYMKRFSWTCHLVLGLALSIAPTGAYIAIQGTLPLGIVFLGLAVGVWIAAFDVIYGCQDVEFDKAHGLNSMPVRFGIQGAMNLAKWMHVLSIVSFAAVGILFKLSWIYYVGVVLAAIVLIYQHSIVSSTDFSKVTQAYFMRNGLVGILMFLFTFASLIF
ncbi:4-hydroxybenzoate octaprenyltransferase [bioreactor metagenome]|uniref:4-hydroxybenzoate octaprenyltransferase n=1 Tax=bioreactor metagenome TaxID=1076179 RepID=A0A645DD25_9ZZZZ